MSDHSENARSRFDNIPITAAVQRRILQEAKNFIKSTYDGFIEYENMSDASKQWLRENEPALLRKFAAPIESAVMGITSTEIASHRGSDEGGDVIDAEPAPDFGELKSRLAHLTEDISTAVGEIHGLSEKEQGHCNEMYAGISLNMTDLVERIQTELVRGGGRSK